MAAVGLCLAQVTASQTRNTTDVYRGLGSSRDADQDKGPTDWCSLQTTKCLTFNCFSLSAMDAALVLSCSSRSSSLALAVPTVASRSCSDAERASTS